MKNGLMTWFQIEVSSTLPSGLCRSCAQDVVTANNIKQLCDQSAQHWDEVTTFLENIQEPFTVERNILVLYYTDKRTSLKEDETELNTETEILEDHKKPKRQKVLSKCDCPYCFKKFKSYDDLNVHLSKSMRRVCHICGSVVKKKNLSKHMSNLHDENVFPCLTCYEILDTPDDVKKHCARYHRPDWLTCNICGLSFVNERGLRAHEYSHTLFSCTSCKKSYDNIRCFKYHQSICIAEILKEPEKSQPKLFGCDYCGLQYEKKPSLKIHIKQKHLNVLQFICQKCGKRASTLTHLKEHERIHLEGRKIWDCHCGRKFKTELGYSLHMRIHSGLKPYQCELCEKSFLSASRRSDHMKRNHISVNDMPHKCNKCNAKFLRPCALKKHYLTIHNCVINPETYKRSLNTSIRLQPH